MLIALDNPWDEAQTSLIKAYHAAQLQIKKENSTQFSTSPVWKLKSQANWEIYPWHCFYDHRCVFEVNSQYLIKDGTVRASWSLTLVLWGGERWRSTEHMEKIMAQNSLSDHPQGKMALWLRQQLTTGNPSSSPEMKSYPWWSQQEDVFLLKGFVGLKCHLWALKWYRPYRQACHKLALHQVPLILFFRLICYSTICFLPYVPYPDLLLRFMLHGLSTTVLLVPWLVCHAEATCAICQTHATLATTDAGHTSCSGKLKQQLADSQLVLSHNWTHRPLRIHPVLSSWWLNGEAGNRPSLTHQMRCTKRIALAEHRKFIRCCGEGKEDALKY